jgi:hypothetical protein
MNLAASGNKGLFIHFLNEQLEDGFYTLVIDYLKDNEFDITQMNVPEDIKASSERLFQLQEFVNIHIKQADKYEIEDWIEPLYHHVYGDHDPADIDTDVNVGGIYRYSVWLIYLYQSDRFEDAMRLIGEKVAPQMIECYYQVVEEDERPKNFDKAVMGYLDLISVVMDMDLTSHTNSELYLNNLEVFYDYLIEDDDVANDYKIQFSMGMFNEYIKNLNYNKAFEFYGLNAEYIPVDNMKVYDSFKDLIRNCDNTRNTNVLNRAVVTAISKQEIYNRRIDSLISDVSQFIKKVCKYIEEDPTMKRNLQILGTGSSLSDKSNIFEGLYEYNLVFFDCGIKALLNQDMSDRSWEEKYEILDILYTTLNVLFNGDNVYELSNKIEHQFIELNWIGNYINGNPALLKGLFSVREKIKAFKIRKDSLIEKNKTNMEIKSMLQDRQKHLVFMAADDMIKNGVEHAKVQVMSNGYDPKKVEKSVDKVYSSIVLSNRYHTSSGGGGFKFGGGGSDETKKLMSNAKVADCISKSEWLWNQYAEKGADAQSKEERTYAIAYLIKAIEEILTKSAPKSSSSSSSSNKRVIVTKTGKVIELSDETTGGASAPAAPESNVISYINNIGSYLVVNTPENVEYVQSYLNGLIDYLMEVGFDKDHFLSVFEADELRSKTWEVIKKLMYDMQ